MRSRQHRGLTLVCAALIAITGMGGFMSHSAGAQTIPAQVLGIVATGFGMASAPASLADVQIVIGPDMYGMSPAMNLTEAEIEPIVDVIVEAGIRDADVEIVIPATTSEFSGSGIPGSALILFEIQQPTETMMRDLVRALNQSVLEARLGIQHIGVRFVTDDCLSLQQSAMDAAVADARERAERMATSLGAEIGMLIQATDSMFFSGNPDSCSGPALYTGGFAPYGPDIAPAYELTTPVEAVVTAQVTLSFEMIAGDTATPIS